ncbi:hypothetical protein BSLG_003039 [Batrachochytrium salamandrivorans]|nr:hypothetical protein BSLG_003039 [Batrachochytrium salamandrivorans]
MDHDITGKPLAAWVRTPMNRHIKCLVKQMFEGLVYLHSMNIIHRDIKAKADFGLARRIYIDRRFREPVSGFDYANQVVTLWYRPPELLLGSTSYGFEVDIWSANFFKTAIFRDGAELSRMDAIIRICGSPLLLPRIEGDWHEFEGKQRRKSRPAHQRTRSTVLAQRSVSLMMLSRRRQSDWTAA